MTFIDFFAGIGGFRHGLEMAGHKCIGYCEWDKFASASYRAMHTATDKQREYLKTLSFNERQKEIEKEEYLNGEWYSNDIRTVTGGTIPRADLWTAGFPCFTKGTFIFTKDGYKDIADVTTDDYVLTHRGNWKRVIKTMQRENAQLWNVSGFGILPTKTTAEHPYYVTTDGENFNFVKCSELANYEKVYSTMVLPKCNDTDSHSAKWWWLAGRYVADGWRVARKGRKFGRVVFACNDEKSSELERRINLAGYNFTLDKGTTCRKYIITKGDFYRDTECFGKYAHGKRIPGFVFELSTEKLEQFFYGYMSGDGRCDREEATSTSPYIVLGMAAIAQRLHKPIPAIYKQDRPKTCIISSRTVTQRTTYTFRIGKSNAKGFYSQSGQYACKLLNKPERTNEFDTVFNISVEDDESYIANGAIVHNCQDLSIAGKQLGFDGNRSSLYFQIIRIIKELQANGRDTPQVLFFENVKNLLSITNGWDFARILFTLDEVGYNAKWNVINTKDFLIPQNRERIFIIAVRKDLNIESFEFPKGDKTMLKDLLERKVAEKYYINNEKATNLIEQLIAKGVLTGGGAIPCDSTINEPNKLDIANCLTARYDAGIQNQKQIGIAVCEEAKDE